MNSAFLEKPFSYDGKQLRSRWIGQTADLQGDAIVSFIGKADVPIENMVDLEDVAANKPIYSEEMLHFIIEIFDKDLERMILRQRLLIAIIMEELKYFPQCQKIHRRGNDLYDEKNKLSVSIATSSPHSCLIHTGINISSRNTPLATKGLNDYDIEPRTFAEAVMKRFCEELKGIRHAQTKVRTVS
ncbi:MAG: DUF366 family protein [Deltaproteobacteria bacterium]|nr:DUF366 family protein [Deltaproteobacteria bacterium]